ncbi:MAG: hypothetical protein KKB20_06180 [Proteobacteria bacterium]|nr:hypothetical protein [Pseudomonadota bacterium]
MTESMSLERIGADELRHLDLVMEVRSSGEVSGPVEVYTAPGPGAGEAAEAGRVELIYYPRIGRAGVARGEVMKWIDCESAEEALERFQDLAGPG